MEEKKTPVIRVKNLYKIYQVGTNKVYALNGVAAKSTPIHELFVYITTILPASDVFPQSSDGCLTSCNLSPR